MVGGNPDIADSKEKYVNILSRLYDKFNNEKGTVLIKHTWDPKIGRVDETVGRYHFPKDTQNFNDYIDRVKNHLSETLFDRHIYTITSTYL
jgi:hypothetical protein